MGVACYARTMDIIMIFYHAPTDNFRDCPSDNSRGLLPDRKQTVKILSVYQAGISDKGIWKTVQTYAEGGIRTDKNIPPSCNWLFSCTCILGFLCNTHWQYRDGY